MSKEGAIGMSKAPHLHENIQDCFWSMRSCGQNVLMPSYKIRFNLFQPNTTKHLYSPVWMHLFIKRWNISFIRISKIAYLYPLLQFLNCFKFKHAVYIFQLWHYTSHRGKQIILLLAWFFTATTVLQNEHTLVYLLTFFFFMIWTKDAV